MSGESDGIEVRLKLYGASAVQDCVTIYRLRSQRATIPVGTLVLEVGSCVDPRRLQRRGGDWEPFPDRWVHAIDLDWEDM